MPLADDAAATWGIKAVAVARDRPGRWTGRGVRIALLDTGVDRAHPDLAARIVEARSLVSGCPVDDEIGHGTHCAGTAVGFRTSTGCRYGIAHDAALYVARVLDRTAGADVATVIAGIDWALSHGCHVIAMPIGVIDVMPSIEFEAAGRRILDAGCLAIAAAGPYWTARVSQPANIEGFIAVGAIDRWSRPFACPAPRDETVTCSGVDFVAPGARIYSTAPGATYALQDGTSMAVAHVAGVAALWGEAKSLRGWDLRCCLVANARRIQSGAGDFEYQLITAP